MAYRVSCPPVGVSTGPLGRWSVPRAAYRDPGQSGDLVIFVGDDWAEDHHDVEVQDEHGLALKAARLPEGVDGMTRFHELVARFLPDNADPDQVLVCIETDRGPWVRALIAAGYQVFGVNPRTGRTASRTAVGVGCQERQGRRARVGGHGPHASPPAASGRR